MCQVERMKQNIGQTQGKINGGIVKQSQRKEKETKQNEQEPTNWKGHRHWQIFALQLEHQ